jgi:hypothetical protein
MLNLILIQSPRVLLGRIFLKGILLRISPQLKLWLLARTHYLIMLLHLYFVSLHFLRMLNLQNLLHLPLDPDQQGQPTDQRGQHLAGVLT